jgi:hypothetical protein
VRFAVDLELALDEDIGAEYYGMPTRCAPGPITWIGPHEVTLEEAAQRAPFPVAVPTHSTSIGEPTVVFEDRRTSFPFASVHLWFELEDGSMHCHQAERFRFALDEDAWDVETVDEWPIAVRRWVMHPTGLPSWSALLRWPGSAVLLESDVLTREEILSVARSLGDPVDG